MIARTKHHDIVDINGHPIEVGMGVIRVPPSPSSPPFATHLRVFSVTQVSSWLWVDTTRLYFNVSIGWTRGGDGVSDPTHHTDRIFWTSSTSCPLVGVSGDLVGIYSSKQLDDFINQSKLMGPHSVHCVSTISRVRRS